MTRELCISMGLCQAWRHPANFFPSRLRGKDLNFAVLHVTCNVLSALCAYASSFPDPSALSILLMTLRFLTREELMASLGIPKYDFHGLTLSQRKHQSDWSWDGHLVPFNGFDPSAQAPQFHEGFVCLATDFTRDLPMIALSAKIIGLHVRFLQGVNVLLQSQISTCTGAHHGRSGAKRVEDIVCC